LFSDDLDDGNSFLFIEEELRGLTRIAIYFLAFVPACRAAPLQ
jgi:hypothetical protein